MNKPMITDTIALADISSYTFMVREAQEGDLIARALRCGCVEVK